MPERTLDRDIMEKLPKLFAKFTHTLTECQERLKETMALTEAGNFTDEEIQVLIRSRHDKLVTLEIPVILREVCLIELSVTPDLVDTLDQISHLVQRHILKNSATKIAVGKIQREVKI